MNPTFEEFIHTQWTYFGMVYRIWRNNLFTIQWWMLLLVFIAPWIVWWKLVDKSRTGEILSYGLLVSLLSATLDETGIALHLWTYTKTLLPLCLQMKPPNISLLPVLYMLIYQYFPRWKSFIIAGTVMAAALAFLGEPFLIWFGIYQVFTWKHIYSFPLYIALAAGLKLLVDAMFARQQE